MSPSRIQQLSAALVNRIAAGEVIERPASVVKELVENAIDAAARQITVEVEDGGRQLIRVSDDGAGIPPQDLPLAFASHATSKLTCDDDLFRIGTMGFRGEALASIGAVSHARILSRTADSQVAWEVHNRGGAISDAQAAAGNAGTVVEVRNLFHNTPARRKFLKGPATEIGHINDMVLRLALPHPAIGFRLIHNGNKPSLDLPPGPAEQRLLSAWPVEFHEQRLPLDVRDAELRLHGIVGLPDLARPTAKHQFLYLNGRVIRDRFIIHALKEAYRGLIEPGRQPAAGLLLEMPPHDVDVNVHPTKSEVRFRDSGRIHGLVLSAVREKLLGSDLTPSASPRAEPNGQPFQDMRARLAAFFKGEGVADNPPERGCPEAGETGAITDKQTSGQGDGPAAEMGDFRAGISDLRSEISDSQSQIPALSPGIGRRPAIPSSQAHPAIQLHNSYLVAQSDDGLLIIDQHALHERIMYEELYARLSRGPLESQRLLIPLVIPANARQMAILEQIQQLLGRLGIEAESFGPNSVAVQAFPTFLEKLDPGRFMQELLERGEQEQLDLHPESLLHEVLDMMACKAAVKAGDPLSAPEIEALLARRELVERSSNCPHGRPTTLRLTLRDLEKQFKRTGF